MREDTFVKCDKCGTILNNVGVEEWESDQYNTLWLSNMIFDFCPDCGMDVIR